MSTRSAPRTSSASISFCKIRRMLGIAAGSMAWAQSKRQQVILGCEEERSLDRNVISDSLNKEREGDLLHDNWILSRHLASTCSFMSVNQIECLPCDPTASCCRLATMMPRNPVPQPSSRIRLWATISNEAVYYMSRLNGRFCHTWV